MHSRINTLSAVNHHVNIEISLNKNSSGSSPDYNGLGCRARNVFHFLMISEIMLYFYGLSS